MAEKAEKRLIFTSAIHSRAVVLLNSYQSHSCGCYLGTRGGEDGLTHGNINIVVNMEISSLISTKKMIIWGKER